MNPLAIKTISLTALSVVGTAIATALGGWDTAMIVLVSVMTIDIVTGLLVAIVWKKSGKSSTGAADSRAIFKGLCRKGLMLLLIWLGVNLDVALGLNGVIRTAIILYFTGNEGLSVIENAGIMGVPLPPIVKNALEQLRNKGGEAK